MRNFLKQSTSQVSNIALICGMVILPTTFAHAADADEASVAFEEIIVTASKRQKNIQDVPIAVTNIGEEELGLRGFSKIDDLAFALPNVSIVNPSDARTSQFTIRGITGQTLFAGAESSVGIFVDNIFLNNPIAQNFDILDIERVEVLRGPQGSLFGKNTAAGVINMITKKPSNDLSGQIGVDYGNYNNIRIKGSLSGPIVEDKVFASMSALYHNRDGFVKNTFTGTDLNTQDKYGFRGGLRFTPSENLEINFAADYLKEDRTPSIPDSTPFDREDELDQDMFEKREVYGASMNVEYEMESGISLTSISSFRDYNWSRLGDDDGSILPAFANHTEESTKQISQEFRVASPDGQRLEWLIGLYYLKADMENTNRAMVNPDHIFQLSTGLTCTQLFTFQFISLGLPAATAAAMAAGFCAPGEGLNEIEQTSKTYAAFANFDYDLTDTLSATLGMRVSSEKKNFSNVQAALNPGFAIAIAPGEADYERKDTTFTPKFALSYKPSEDVNIYASAASGVKSGGFNTSQVATPTQLLETEYDKETLWSYEIGVKADLWDKRVRLNVAAFHIDYKDLQVFRFEEVGPGIYSSRITNAAKAKSEGFEVELQVMPHENITVKSSLGYTKSKYTDFDNCGVEIALVPTAIDCTGNRLSNAPELTSNVNATYQAALPGSDSLHLILNAEWSYRGETYYDVFNNDDARQGGVSIVNATAALTEIDMGVTLSAYAQNLFDKEYITIAVPGFVGRISELGAPRTYGLRLDVKF